MSVTRTHLMKYLKSYLDLRGEYSNQYYFSEMKRRKPYWRRNLLFQNEKRLLVNVFSRGSIGEYHQISGFITTEQDLGFDFAENVFHGLQV